MILQEREIYLTYQNPHLMRIFIEQSREGIHAFNDFLLNALKEQYEHKAYKGQFIQSITAIKQRSAIQVG